MHRERAKNRRTNAAITRNLMLAPAVMALRLPLMTAEAGGAKLTSETAGAVSEKMTAFTEGLAAAQFAWMRSAMLMPFAFASATSVMSPFVDMAEAVTAAALAPAGKQVRKNHKRLTGRR
ncbi:MAG: hypothetical protein Q8Q62_16090 [Mesorhizobium sp.]|nr:hypothetical protein [Mesorhizobium sp.]